jgi:hypothetical protein
MHRALIIASLTLLNLSTQSRNVVLVNGQAVLAQGSLNLIAGTGITYVCVPNANGKQTDCTASYNTALAATHDTVHANENFCNSTTLNTTYICALPNKKLAQAYTLGMTFLLDVDTTCQTSCTINIDGQGTIGIKKIDGQTDPGGALIAGQPQPIFFDGEVFRLIP